MRKFTNIISLIGLLLLVQTSAQAQGEVDFPIQTIPAAETSFSRGLAAYERGDFAGAHDLFMEVVTDYAFNRKTTAALLMAGKALLAQGYNERTADLMERFIDDFPTSRYFTEAQRTRDVALSRLEGEAALRATVFDLGIVLPSSGRSALFAQSLFNGIRLAVDEHNARNPLVPVRMNFRSAEATERQIRNAVNALVSDHNAGAIIGPLTSEEAIAAGAEAERLRVPLVAPMATDDRVAAGRRFVFMANPSWSMRGRVMARFAVESLRMSSVGVVAQQGTFGEQMASAFRDEALRLGAEVPVYHLVRSSAEWGQLHAFVGRDTLTGVRGLYLPITGMGAPAEIQAALYSIGQISPDLRILGNGEWHALPIAPQASLYRTVYEMDYWLNENAQQTREFIRQYRQLAGEDPDRTAIAGYDVARFVLSRIEIRRPDESLVDALRTRSVHQGLGTRIDFSTGTINQGAFFVEYRTAGPRLMY